MTHDLGKYAAPWLDAALYCIQPWKRWLQFEGALGIAEPWFVRSVDFDAEKKMLTIGVDFIAGSRFALPGVQGNHPAHDTVTRRYRHLNFFQHECQLDVCTHACDYPTGESGRSNLTGPDGYPASHYCLKR